MVAGDNQVSLHIDEASIAYRHTVGRQAAIGTAACDVDAARKVKFSLSHGDTSGAVSGDRDVAAHHNVAFGCRKAVGEELSAARGSRGGYRFPRISPVLSLIVTPVAPPAFASTEPFSLTSLPTVTKRPLAPLLEATISASISALLPLRSDIP